MTLYTFSHQFLQRMMSHMDGEPKPKWYRCSTELPPGWHEGVGAVAEACGMKLKYVYMVAVDRLLREKDASGVADAVWQMQRGTATNFKGISASHSVDELRKRYRSVMEKNRLPNGKKTGGQRKAKKKR